MSRFRDWDRSADEAAITAAIQAAARPLRHAADLDELVSRLSRARIVMLGEASHGTHEYYVWRSIISRRLIEAYGFQFIAVEGDWPDCYRLNRYVKGYMPAGHARDVLHEMNRWPTWMWANWETVALAEWMRAYNHSRLPRQKAGFYGLDVYSLWESMEAVMAYLEQHDAQALQLARKASRCFEPYVGDEGRDYALALRLVPELCEREVIALLQTIRSRMTLYDHDPEQVFSTEQNALIAVNAERYYRAMLQGGSASWNVRDSHMQESLERLLQAHGPGSKAIVWAHNTHIGDARATDMAEDGSYNIGQLAREQFGSGQVALVGFGSYDGTVVAGRNWGDPMEVMHMPRAKSGSWEYMLQRAGTESKWMLTEDLAALPELQEAIGHRAIGVVYRPEREWGNYVPSIIPERYDAFIYTAHSRALHPLHLKALGGMVPETYPFGF